MCHKTIRGGSLTRGLLEGLPEAIPTTSSVASKAAMLLANIAPTLVRLSSLHQIATAVVPQFALRGAAGQNRGAPSLLSGG